MIAAALILCAVTALCCGLLLFRGYRRSGARLLFWCALFFCALALENVVLICDLLTGAHIDLTMAQKTTGLAAVVLLLYGLVWESN